MKPTSQGAISAPDMSSSRLVRRVVAIVCAIMVVIGLVLLLFLTQATSNRALDEANYTRLFVINVAVATLLLVALCWVGYRLTLRFRQGKFGSRLLIKLATIFALVGIAPGVLIYVVSYQFVSRSIETWFDVKVEGALESGLSLGRASLDALSSDLSTKSRTAALQISASSAGMTGFLLERLLEPLGATDLAIWSASGKLIASAAQSRVQLIPDKPSASQLRLAQMERALSWVEGLEDTSSQKTATSSAYIKVLVPIGASSIGLTAEEHFLLVSKELPANLVGNAVAVDSAYREYQERALSRDGLKRIYIGTLTLSLFLAVFGAVLLAVILGNQIVRPLLVLAKGVTQVAAGDLTPTVPMSSKDELGELTRAFASMIEQLADARRTSQDSMARLDDARANLQTILDNLTAGVMVLGIGGEIRSANPSAARILGIALHKYEGQSVDAIEELKEFWSDIRAHFKEFMAQRVEGGADHWQRSFELAVYAWEASHDPFGKTLSIVARGAELPDNTHLLVFDDISEIVSAQRARAWGEVARRLAHEIKNPLTPIQLSAERLGMKLSGKLPALEQGILEKSIKTIVEQVSAMKRLVNEFRDYARLPAALLAPVDLNALVTDVIQLYDASTTSVPIHLELDPTCPAVRGDAQQLRQVIHNLLQNAQDASENKTSDPQQDSCIIVRTQWQGVAHRVRMSVLDQGAGFADHILKRAFEPYVTTKDNGTGLGLAVVKKIADEHAARIEITNRLKGAIVVGAQVSMSFPVYESLRT